MFRIFKILHFVPFKTIRKIPCTFASIHMITSSSEGAWCPSELVSLLRTLRMATRVTIPKTIPILMSAHRLWPSLIYIQWECHWYYKVVSSTFIFFLTKKIKKTKTQAKVIKINVEMRDIILCHRIKLYWIIVWCINNKFSFSLK